MRPVFVFSAGNPTTCFAGSTLTGNFDGVSKHLTAFFSATATIASTATLTPQGAGNHAREIKTGTRERVVEDELFVM
jgi:hypothetical protein